MTTHVTPRRGYVMLTTLWVMSVASVVAMGAALVGREDVKAAATRVELERAKWIAAGCERRVQAAIDSVLGGAATLEDATTTWRTLDRQIPTSSIAAECGVSLEAAGTRVDVNSATPDILQNLFAESGFADRATAMTAAIENWIAANGPLADVSELRVIPDVGLVPGFDSLATTEPGRVSLATAPAAVLAAVPGITRETAERIGELRAAGTPPADLQSLVSSISEESASELASHFSDASHATTPDPDAWIVRATVARGVPMVSAVLDWRIVRVGRRCAVSQTRSRP